LARTDKVDDKPETKPTAPEVQKAVEADAPPVEQVSAGVSQKARNRLEIHNFFNQTISAVEKELSSRKTPNSIDSILTKDLRKEFLTLLWRELKDSEIEISLMQDAEPRAVKETVERRVTYLEGRFDDLKHHNPMTVSSLLRNEFKPTRFDGQSPQGFGLPGR